MNKFSLLLLIPGLFLAALLPAVAWSEDKRDFQIATTIRPLQLIAEAIVKDVQAPGSVKSVIGAGQSPHHYSLSPSSRVVLERADLLIWIGPEFEVYLADLFAQMAESDSGSKSTLTAMQLDGINLHKLTATQVDAHLWLDSTNALKIAAAIARFAVEFDSLNADAYEENLSQFTREIESMNVEIASSLALTARPYIVYHNAYQYFEKQFGLDHQLSLLSDPETQPGIRELLATRRRIKEESPQCLILEPDSNPNLIATILSGHELSRVTIDLLGYNMNAESGSYIKFMRGVAAAFRNCLY